jgi:hypothetical protein
MLSVAQPVFSQNINVSAVSTYTLSTAEKPSPGCYDYIAAYHSTVFQNYAYGSPFPNDPNFSDVPFLTNSSEIISDNYNFYNARVEPGNPVVHDKAVGIVSGASNRYSSYTFDQICAIYDYLYHGWHYVLSGTSGHYANETLKLGEEGGCSGEGNCEDFAIVMASMIEAIGGSARIIVSEDSANGGSSHAYAEVYMGGALFESLEPLAKKYGTANGKNVTANPDGGDPFKMFFHDLRDGCSISLPHDPNDYWLNLDWAANHPGGPFVKGQKSYIVWQSASPHNPPNQPPKGRW